MNESLFLKSNILSIVCGILGLATTLIWPEWIVELHLWELIVIPFVLVQIYWMMVQKTLGKEEAFDEKQAYDMTTAAALTWGLSIPLMAIFFLIDLGEVRHSITWFPYYIFVTIFLYSASTIYYFKKT